MTLLNRTPQERMVDGKGRPYFLWDVELTLEEFLPMLRDPDPHVRGYALGKLMRQAKPDDVFTFVSLADIRANWSRLEKHLGRSREFWRWLLQEWKDLGVA